jgi:hypothetical protein
VSARPVEEAAWAAQQDAVAQVVADCAGDLHSQEVMAAHEGRPTVQVQDRENGTGFPPVDLGPEIGSVTG